MQGLDPDRQEEWVQIFLKDQKIDNDMLVRAAAVLATYMNQTMLDPQHKNPYDALNSAGFFNLPPAVQTIVCAKLGQVFMSAFFSAMRDITRDPSDPPLDTKAIAQVAADLQTRLIQRNQSLWTRLRRWWAN